MSIRDDYEQLKAYTRTDGAIVGGLWVLSFAFFIGEFYNPLFGFAMMFVGVFSLVFAAMRLKRYRDNVAGGAITFGRALLYSMLVYFYAALLMAAGQFVYFQFIDGGFLVSQYAEMVASVEYKAMLSAYGATTDDMQVLIDNLAALRPIDIALQFFTANIILGFFVSLPIAVMMKRTVRR